MPAGHEWFANNITYKDIADMWVHEGFTDYSESLFLEYHYSKKAGYDYVVGTRRNIGNKSPITGSYGVNASGSGDMYSKGANMLHTLRQIVNDDEKWRNILRGLNETFYHQTVTSQQIENYLEKHSGLDLTAFFNQYLRDIRIPVLEYRFEGKQLWYRWGNCVEGFAMPVRVRLGNEWLALQPSARWSKVEAPAGGATLELDADFYVTLREISGK